MQISIATENRNAYASKTIAQIQNTMTSLEHEIIIVKFDKDRLGIITEKKSSLIDDFNLSTEKLLFNNIVNIETQLASKGKELENLENTLQSSNNILELNQMNTLETGESISISSLWLNALIDSYTIIDAKKTSLNELNQQMNSLQEQADLHTINSHIDGVINVIIELNIGDVVTPNTAIATILPYGESEYRVLLYVDSKDIIGIEIGSDVKFEIPALPSQTYGDIYGQVINISRDTKSINIQETGYFLIECSIDNKELFDKNGKKASIEVGMIVQGRIIVREIRIIDFILQALDFIIK